MLALIFAAVLPSTPPAAPPQPAPPASVAAKDAHPRDKLVCRTEAVTGSLFSRRVCLTQEDWARQQKGGQDLVKDAQDRVRPSVPDAPH